MNRFIMVLVFFIVAAMPSLALAADVNPVLVPPDWLGGLLIWLQSVPYVGPVLTEIFKWIGVLSAVATALSIAAQLILSLPEIVARFAGAPALADKIKYYADKILYWLKFFSIQNAKK